MVRIVLAKHSISASCFPMSNGCTKKVVIIQVNQGRLWCKVCQVDSPCFVGWAHFVLWVPDFLTFLRIPQGSPLEKLAIMKAFIMASF